ncbi:phosphatase and actin regulator 4-like isoform X6 [Scyliorhinus torazame]|uniref:phosphatase and actin regulator 4-like isoform X6 n=1 Tax=Scyliorhinus torazame TaxID=75743 RepID=UPI003B5C4114
MIVKINSRGRKFGMGQASFAKVPEAAICAEEGEQLPPVGSENDVSGSNTPTARRRGKFPGFGKIFKPWKWRKKKTSEKFKETSAVLDRKLSVRQSRTELVKKGVLKEIPEQDGEINSKPAQNSTLKNGHTVPVGKLSTSTKAEPVARGEKRSSFSKTPQEIEGRMKSSTEEPQKTKAELSHIMTPGLVVPGKHSPPGSHRRISFNPPVAEPNTIQNACENKERPQLPMQVSTSAHAPTSSPALPSRPPSAPEPAPRQSLPPRPPVRVTPPVLTFCHASVQHEKEPDQQPHPSSDDCPELLPTRQSQVPLHIMIQQALCSPRPVITAADCSNTAKSLLFEAAFDDANKTRALQVTLEKLKCPSDDENTEEEEEEEEQRPENHGYPELVPSVVIIPELVRQDEDVSDSDDDGPVLYKDDYDEDEEDDQPSSLANKVKRKDTLALKLSNRPTKQELIEKNILPRQSDQERLEIRQQIGTALIRRLSQRPTAEELEQRNILKNKDEEQHEAEKREIKRRLTRKLSQRPTVAELQARKILRFHEYVEVTDAHDYDRRADKPWTKLTPADKAAIRKELNEFKSTEMEVHEESRMYTRFHRP